MCPQRIRIATFVALLAIASPTITATLLAFSSVSPTLAQTSDARKAEAERLLNECRKNLDDKQFQLASKSCEESANAHRAIGNRDGEMRSLYNLGLAYEKMEQYRKAIQQFEKSLDIAIQLGDRKITLNCVNQLGDNYRIIEDFAKATRYYKLALAIEGAITTEALQASSPSITGQPAPKNPKPVYREVEVKLLNQEGEELKSRGQLTEALETFQRALLISREVGDRQGEAAALSNMGITYVDLGQYSKALEFLQQALAINEEVGNRLDKGTILHNIGGVYLDLGEYAKALDFLQQSLKIRRAVGDSVGASFTLDGIGAVYASLGQYSKALEFHQQALAVCQVVISCTNEGNVLSNIGSLYSSWGQYSKALKFLEQALEVHRAVGARALEGRTLNSIGWIYSNLGQPQKALEFFQQALAISKETGALSLESAAIRGIGAAYDDLGEHSKALESLQQALTIAKKLGDRSSEANIVKAIGSNLLASGNAAAAEKSLTEAVSILESLRPGLTDESKVSLIETQRGAYRLLQRALIAQNKTEAALEVVERGQARAFVELVARSLRGQQSTISHQLDIKPPNIQQIRQIARAQNATLVQYSVIGNKSLYIWAIKPTGEIAFRQVDLKSLNSPSTPSTDSQRNAGQSALSELIVSTHRSLGVVAADSQDTGTVSFQADPSKMQRQLKRLHQLLIDPIADLLPTDPNQSVIFIPQDVLFLVPFPALRDANDKYLIEKHTILTAPSIQVLDLTRQQKGKVAGSNGALVVGNPVMPKVVSAPGTSAQQLPPLPAAETEAKAISSLFNTQPLLGVQATKAAIMQKMPQARVIHLATHGLLDDTRGLDSAIALTPSGKDDGWLTAEEILDMKLKADLVVLSACNTGRGRITGDGVVGLSRSLIAAGTPSVLVSLWSVNDDSTAMLMTEFYQNLQRQPNKAKALRQAMLTTMKARPNPIDWAAFTLIGEAE